MRALPVSRIILSYSPPPPPPLLAGHHGIKHHYPEYFIFDPDSPTF